MIRRMCIIGVGLIGGSIAKALRDRGLCRNIVGVDANSDNLERALQLGVIDHASDDPGDGAFGADWVMIAVPVGAFDEIFQRLRPVWSEKTVYTDAGSTKESVIHAARKVFGEAPANFVPGHPIAGAELSGVDAARDDLFSGKRVILTPVAETDPRALDDVAGFWRAIGATVSTMSPGYHDEVLAATSHLPHVLAFALTRMLGRMDEQREIFKYAAGGFRDFTRIASSDPNMWLDICFANREQIIPLLNQLADEMRRVADLLENGRSGELHEYFTDAREARQRYLFKV